MNRSTELDFDQRIADWLEDDPNLAPRQVLDTVLAAYPSIPQRRRAPWRFPTMTLTFRLATAAVIGALVLGGAFLLTGGGSRPSTVVPTTVAPSWTGSGSLGTARVDFAAATLADGRTLVSGGSNAGGGLASAEVYDPTTGKWTTTGSMSQTRGIHTLTRLANGKVLAIGGQSDATSVTELYDPATGTWTTTGSPTYPRGQVMAALLSDGRVLVAGGTQTENALPAEIYDPATGTWTLTGSDEREPSFVSDRRPVRRARACRGRVRLDSRRWRLIRDLRPTDQELDTDRVDGQHQGLRPDRHTLDRRPGPRHRWRRSDSRDLRPREGDVDRNGCDRDIGRRDRDPVARRTCARRRRSWDGQRECHRRSRGLRSADRHVVDDSIDARDPSLRASRAAGRWAGGRVRGLDDRFGRDVPLIDRGVRALRFRPDPRRFRRSSRSSGAGAGSRRSSSRSRRR